jgi:hypothetical protein
VTTISVISKYLRMLDLWLKNPWLQNIYVCWMYDYDIRDFYIFTYVGPVTIISVTSKYLRMLDMWLQYLWRVNSYVCWTWEYNSVTSKYLCMLDMWLQYPGLLIFTYVGPVATISVTFNIYACWKCDYNIRDLYIFTYVEPVITISVTSKYLRMMDLPLQYSWHLNINVLLTDDYNIRDT